jgi:hypothetical protein
MTGHVLGPPTHCLWLYQRLDPGVTARPGGSAPVGGGPRHREVSSATQVAGSVRGTKPPNRCRARHRTRSVPPRPEPDPFAPAFARRKRTMAKACDHCAADRSGLGEPRSDPPDRAGTGNVYPTGQGVKSPTRLDAPTCRQSRERPPPMGEPLGIPGAGAGSLSPRCMNGGDLRDPVRFGPARDRWRGTPAGEIPASSARTIATPTTGPRNLPGGRFTPAAASS